MKPPRCAVCEKRFFAKKEGDLVSFKLTDEQKLKKQEMQQKGHVGHPVGKLWFCNEHLQLAKKYSHLTVIEAFKEIREDESSPIQKIKNYFRSLFN